MGYMGWCNLRGGATSRSRMHILIICFVKLLSLFCNWAWGSTIVVDTTADDRTSNGNCTLHEAMEAANTNTVVDSCTAGEPGLDTVDLSGIAGDIYLSTTLPFTEEDMTIIGPGDENLLVHANGIGGSIFRIKSLSAQVTVNISGIRITGGNITGNGGGIYVYPGNTLNLSSCRVDNNSAALDGGGIINDQGKLSITNCDLLYNTSAQRGGGLANFAGELTITNSSIGNNTSANNGGGIFNLNGTVELSHSVLEANTAGYQGGGIYSSGTDGETTLFESTIAGNNTINHGAGGIYNAFLSIMTLTRVTISQNKTPDWYAGGGIWNDGTITIEESTISGNTSNNADGGILNQGTAILKNSTISSNIGVGFTNSAADTAEAELTNCTIALNTEGGITNWKSLTLKNTVVANNTSYDCTFTDPIISSGFNLDSDNTCGLTGPGDLPNTDPLLGPLDDNGGPTLTHALQTRSPAIDAGDNIVCPATDQRGIKRPQDGDRDGKALCDIGAYELSLSKATPWIPLLLLDD